ncbi:NAD-binding protein [Fomitiporia mediterranea MF3/22]|uniref:NAD-binding protein n=1 Tax=Fomitiporia mediterranea (strain MF3/22) TaxID=694068 RepID=UPI0004407C9C|nr:NAD-binding protein [Fomitiporia mediterranea MF3/22]EJD02529.1 NAD-binding protein [Fomitiporia mediterranea MF3/22]
MPPLTSLVVGASRGLGLELVRNLHARGSNVFATVRSPPQTPDHFPNDITVIDGVDVGEEKAGDTIVKVLDGRQLDLVIINAGVFKTETLEKPSFADELDMYKTVAIAPVFLTHHLRKSNSFAPGAKLVLITTEGGSIALRTKEEGGGNYGHHASKAAANMVGRLLSHDLVDDGVAVVMIHPGFMRTDMTKNVGFDKFYDSGGAVLPSEAAASVLDFVANLSIKDTGSFWAPRGPRDIGEAERVLGKDLPTPLRLPW